MADAVNDRIIDPVLTWAQAHPVETALLSVPLVFLLWPLFLWGRAKMAEADERGKARGKHLGERDIAALSPVQPNISATSEEIAQAVAAQLRNDDSLVAGIAAKLNAAGESPVTEQAVATFLRTLGEEEVPAADLPAKLDSIAANHRKLLQELAVLHPTNAQAAALVAEAAQAAEQGERARVDQLLAEAGALEDGDIDRLETVLDDRRKNAARIEAERARNALAGLDHETAARHFEAAADKLGDTEYRWWVLLMDSAATEWLVLGRVSKAAELQSQIHAVLVYRNEIDPYDAEIRRNLSVSYINVGDMLARQGDGAAALLSYRQALALRQALAEADPDNAMARRDLTVSHNKIGDMLARQGDGTAALDYYRQALALRQNLAGTNPGDAEAQHDLGSCYDRIGNMLARQGDGAGALGSYRNCLSIAQSLVEADPSDARALRNLSVSYTKVGDMLARQGDGAAALDTCRQALALREALAEVDPSDAQARRDLSFSYNQVGDMLVRQGDGAAALDSYRQAMALREALAEVDPNDAQARRDLSVSYTKIGDMLARQGDGAAAQSSYSQALTLRQALAAADPTDARAQIDLAISHHRLAFADPDRTLSHAQAIAAICQGLRQRCAWHEHLEDLETFAAKILAGTEQNAADLND